MRIVVTMTDLDEQEWSYLHRVVQTHYEMNENADRVCLTFNRGPMDRHVEMPMHAYGSILTGMALDKAMTAFNGAFKKRAETLKDTLEAQRNAADPARRPVLPTPEQVRNMSAEDAAKLARELNIVRPNYDPDFADRLENGAYENCGHHNPPHLYDCRKA